MNKEFPDKPLNEDITTCIAQLAQRASELGEENTAVVLFTLAGHRTIRADYAMAIVASEQALILSSVITTLNGAPKPPTDIPPTT